MSNNRFLYCTLDPNFVPDDIKALTDLGECVNRISGLPERVLADLQFLPGSNEEKELIEGIREIYYWTEQWLSYYLLDQHQIKYRLESTDGKHFQSHAELSAALYRLCKEVHPYPGWTQFFNSPTGLWLSCEYERCLLGFENSGLIGEPLIVSKREFAANIAKFCGKQGRGNTEKIIGSLENPEEKEIRNGYKTGTPIKHASPFYMLILTASYLIREDIKFPDKVYRDYLKADKRHARAVLNNSNLHSICLAASGDIINTQSTANLPGSRLGKRPSKGFGRKK